MRVMIDDDRATQPATIPHWAHSPVPRPLELKTWYVLDNEDVEHIVVAHYCFNNGAEGLIFRRRQYDDPRERAEVVAAFAPGFWKFYKNAQTGGWKHS